MKYGIIYKHSINGKCYIGQTIHDVNVRTKNKRSSSAYRGSRLFFHIINKYGWDNIVTEELVSCFDQEELDKAETYFINYFNSVHPNGYNLKTEGKGKGKLSQETKEIIRTKAKERYERMEERPVAPNRKHHTFVNGVEHKECANCKENKLLSEFGKYSTTWDGLNRYCKVCHNERTNATRPKYQKLSPEELKESYKNRQDPEKQRLVYENEPERKKIISKQRSKAIVATNVLTNEKLEFESAKVAKNFGFDNTNIGIAIKLQKVYKGHIWRFKE